MSASASPPGRGPAGLVAGVRALLGGVGFVVSRPANYPLAAVPVAVFGLLLTTLGALGIWAAARAAHAFHAHYHGALGALGAWLLGLVAGVAGLLLALFLGLSLAQPLAGPALEALARRQEAALGGPLRPDEPWLAGTLRSLRVTLAALVLATPILALLALVGIVLPIAAVVTVPLKFVVTSLVVAWDLLDYPFSIRGMRVRERVRWMRAHGAAVLGFGMASALLLLVPFVGLLLLPVGAAGATRLVVQGDAEPAPSGTRS